MRNVDFKNYQSPFSWRYATQEMREIFSEENKRKTWRQVWVALAKTQKKQGLLTDEEFEQIEKHANSVDIEKAQKLEEEIKHDLVAELKTFADQVGKAGGKLHLGATSQDIEDNADVIIFNKALNFVEKNLKDLLSNFAKKIEKNMDVVCMAYTHLQPAEPTTLGYRFSNYAQDFLMDLELLEYVKKNLKGKGFKGAVGNSASYYSLLGQKAKDFEKSIASDLNIEFFDLSTQVYPRKQDFLVLSLLASIAQSLYRFAFDLRILQSPGFGELLEPFGKKQVGSSAMPFKRNPIVSEKICSLARYITALSRVSWDTAANSHLERTLDDSASRRIIIPESFLAIDEMLNEAIKIVDGITVNTKKVEDNLEKYGLFSAIEPLLLSLTQKGANRQKMHELFRNLSMEAYQEMEKSGKNPLFTLIKNDKEINRFLSPDEIEKALNLENHFGMAKKKSEEMVAKIKEKIR